VRVTVVCYGAMRGYLPASRSDNRAELELPDGATVGDAVDILGAPRRLVFCALVDGERTALDEALADGAEVTLMPPFTGGARRTR